MGEELSCSPSGNEIACRSTEITCPVCNINTNIDIPEYIFQQNQIGLIKIQIRSGSVCPHDFIAFVDQTGTVRGYEHADFQIKFTARTEEDRKTTDNLFLEDLLETLGEFATVRLFHAFNFNYKVFILITPKDDPRFVDRLNKLFSNFFPADMQPRKSAEGIDQKRFTALDINESNSLIMNTSGIVANSPWGDQKKFDFETEVIKKALEIIDVTSQFLLVQQEIANLNEKAETVIVLLKKTDKIYTDELKDKLSKQLKTKVTDYLIDLYIQFIKQNIPKFEPLLKKIQDRSVET